MGNLNSQSDGNVQPENVHNTSNVEAVVVAIGDPAALVPNSRFEGKSPLKRARATIEVGAAVVAIGSVVLNVSLPAGAIIKQAVIDVITTFTSATDAATIAIQVEGAGDVRAAVAISSGTSWDAGLKACVPIGTVATMFKTTIERQITAVIAVEDLTAGKAHVYIDYDVSDLS